MNYGVRYIYIRVRKTNRVGLKIITRTKRTTQGEEAKTHFHNVFSPQTLSQIQSENKKNKKYYAKRALRTFETT